MPVNSAIVDSYWQVYFDTNRLIRESFDAAGFPAPMPALAVTGVLSGPSFNPIR